MTGAAMAGAIRRAAVLVLMGGLAACGSDSGITVENPDLPYTVIDVSINVPPGEDESAYIDLPTSLAAGWRIRVTLSAPNTTLKPFAFLDAETGPTINAPPVETAANGTNTIELLLPQGAPYYLTIKLSPTNVGGAVSVKVERIA